MRDADRGRAAPSAPTAAVANRRVRASAPTASETFPLTTREAARHAASSAHPAERTLWLAASQAVLNAPSAERVSAVSAVTRATSPDSRLA